MSETRWVFIHPFQLRLQRGIEVYLWNLADALIKDGIEVDILTWDGPIKPPDYIRNSKVKLHKVPSVRYFQAWFAVPYYVYWLLKGKYQHIFVNFAGFGEGLALRLVRLVRPIRFSLVVHFPRSLVPHRYDEFVRWNYQRNAKYLIAVSQATASEVKQWAGRTCSVIGHGVDTHHFHPDAGLRVQVRQELGLGKETPVLITVAALEERKGMQFVIQAMPKVLEEMPDARYLIIGEGTYKETLVELARSLNLQNTVLFLGFQGDVERFLAASDIAILLSRGEASPVSLLEFTAAGLPVLTSLHPPFPELVSDWGEMVPEQDAGQVSQAIINLLSNKELRSRRGAQGRAWVIENNNWHQVTRKYKDLVGFI